MSARAKPRTDRLSPSRAREHALRLGALAALCSAAYWSLLDNGFVNWDDPDALAGNASLDDRGVVAWAFGTTHMSHYQPLAWLAWAAARRLFGASPATHHALSLAFHVLNALLVYGLAWLLFGKTSLGRASRRLGALAAASLFALHPLRVEAVAWASGFPYVLALAWLLVSTLCYLHAAGTRDGRAGWLAVSVVTYAASLLSRAVAPGFPLVLLCLDAFLGRLPAWDSRRVKQLLLEKAPFVLLAAAATWAEGSARRFASLEQVGLGFRISDAATAPLVYLWRTLLPIGLSPLQALPLDPRGSWPALLAGVLSLAGLTAVVARAWPRYPALAPSWLAFLILLGPALGLAPTGLQATADRYTYFPGVVVGLLAGGGFALAVQRSRRRGAWLGAAGLLLLALLAGSAWQARFWRDSRTLWTRAVALDPRNDIALYNLAQALAEAGEDAQAAERYRQTLGLLPDHGPARRNLALLEAARLEGEAGALAEAGRLEEAVARYGDALVSDPARLRSRISRGMALVELGRLAEAVQDLRSSRATGPPEPAVANALGLALASTGATRESREVVQEALRLHPDDIALAHNLARLLVTDKASGPAERAEGLRLAQRVVEATGGGDPLALATLAEAYAAAGETRLARETRARALAEARRQGRPELAAQIEERPR